MRYDDIIDMPHHVSKTHRQMPMSERAAQFSPFAALTGYDDAVAEAGRPEAEQVGLGVDEREEMDRKLSGIIPLQTEVCFTVMETDGTFRSKKGKVRRISALERRITMEDGSVIGMEQILGIELEDDGRV